MAAAFAGGDGRQERLSGVVWGLTLMAMGALFMLDSLGAVDMGSRSTYAAGRAVDGDTSTRWSSAFHDPQWISVDLGARHHIESVRLVWEAAHAAQYEVQLSNDGTRWTTAKEVTEGRGGTEEHALDTSARFVRMSGKRRATQWGYSLRELEVYGRGRRLLSAGKDATASSRESSSYWLLVWPLLLVAAGLPALIAPKDPGNQVMGALLTGAGLVILCRNFGWLAWGFNETVATLLLLVGSILVVQALRGGSVSPPGGSTPASGPS